MKYSGDEVPDSEAMTTQGISPTLMGSALAQLNASEIDIQISTARAFPRHLAQVRREIYNLVIADEDTAASMIYALPRGREKNPATGQWEQKVISGPTARFAEVMAYGWGNNRCGARVISEDDEFVTAQGVFFDLEKNTSWSVEVKRRITDREGRRYNADMIGVTANAALSIAGRNAILKAIPRAWWKGLLEAAEQTIKGDIKTLNERRIKLIEQFKPFGLTTQMVCRVLGVGGASEISLEHLGILQGTLTALRDGETTVEQLMSDAVGADSAVAEKGKQKLDEVKKKYAKPGGASPEAQQAQSKLEQKRRSAAPPATEAAPAAAENLDAEPVEQQQQLGEEGW